MGSKVLSTPVAPGTAGAQASWTDVDAVIATASGAAWPGDVGVQGLIVDTQPADTETYTLQLGASSTVVYTFVTVVVEATDVLIGANVAATQANLATAIIANQSTWVEAEDWGAASPLYLWNLAADDAITQTDGTGGNLTLYADDALSPRQSDGTVIAPFHFDYQANSVNVTESLIIFAFPVNYEPTSYTLIAARGKGVDAKSMEGFACTAAMAISQYPSGQWVINVDNAGATAWVNGDWITIFGLMKYTG